MRFVGQKVEAGLWVAAAVLVIYYTNFVRVMFTHKGVNKYSSLLTKTISRPVSALLLDKYHFSYLRRIYPASQRDHGL